MDQCFGTNDCTADAFRTHGCRVDSNVGGQELDESQLGLMVQCLQVVQGLPLLKLVQLADVTVKGLFCHKNFESLAELIKHDLLTTVPHFCSKGNKHVDTDVGLIIT